MRQSWLANERARCASGPLAATCRRERALASIKAFSECKILARKSLMRSIRAASERASEICKRAINVIVIRPAARPASEQFHIRRSRELGEPAPANRLGQLVGAPPPPLANPISIAEDSLSWRGSRATTATRARQATTFCAPFGLAAHKSLNAALRLCSIERRFYYYFYHYYHYYHYYYYY